MPEGDRPKLGQDKPTVRSPWSPRPSGDYPPDPPLPRIHVVHDDLGKTPRWKKVFLAIFRILGIASGPAAASSAAQPVPAQVYVVHNDSPVSLSISQTAQLHAAAESILQPTRVDDLTQMLFYQFPAENTPEKRAEAKSLLHHAFEELRSGTGEIAKDIFKDGVKDIAKIGFSAILLDLAAWLIRRGRAKGAKAIEWLGSVVEKIARLLHEHPEARSVSPTDVAAQCGCTSEQAEAVLKFLGFRQEAGRWLPPSV